MDQREQALASDMPPAEATVLVVEDEVLVRHAATKYLRSCGFTVLDAIDAEEALEILQTGSAVDIVFSDVKLPGSRNGVDLARVVRSDHAYVKVLLTSGVAPFPQVDGVTLIRKPYFLFEVERQIRMLLGLSRQPLRAS